MSVLAGMNVNTGLALAGVAGRMCAGCCAGGPSTCEFFTTFTGEAAPLTINLRYTDDPPNYVLACNDICCSPFGWAKCAKYSGIDNIPQGDGVITLQQAESDPCIWYRVLSDFMSTGRRDLWMYGLGGCTGTPSDIDIYDRVQFMLRAQGGSAMTLTILLLRETDDDLYIPSYGTIPDPYMFSKTISAAPYVFNNSITTCTGLSPGYGGRFSIDW